MDDRNLLEAYRRGDPSALDTVFRHYAPAVARWLSSGFAYESGAERHRFEGFSSPADQHETMQEVFRRVFETSARLRYSGLSPFEGYLFVTTRNIVLRRLQRDRRHVPLEVDQDLVDESDSPEERVQQREVQSLVRRFLAELAPDDRHLLALRFVEGLSQESTGRALGWSRKKVRNKESALREALVRFLGRARGSREVTEVFHVSVAL